MTRLGQGVLQPETVPSDLRELASAARHRLRGPLRDNPVRLDFPEDMTPAQVDPILIAQVVINILDNACKYAGLGKAIVNAGHVQGRRAILTIQDDGPGLPLGDAAQVFDMFWRSEQVDGGTIRAEAVLADGRGTCIVIDLSLAVEPKGYARTPAV